ncbi:MT-A70 family methyltransferase [Citreimonas sp.]|uniref:MT-A70 family methyltransferase n=1 Tax=Citreimonas sp. TaxID=3036715 RepID=UPI004057DD9D
MTEAARQMMLADFPQVREPVTDSTGVEIIVADPPWRFASNSEAKPGRNAMRHYPCMTVEQIAALDVPACLARKALLFMWTTAPFLVESLPVLDAWGFEYVSHLVWVKDSTGTGYWARSRHEIVLIAKRGKFPCPKPAPFADSVIIAPVREHSRKPSELQDRIDEIWPDRRKLEIFARQRRAGWEAFGNQVGKFE